MEKVIIIGSFGCGNKGDDAILDSLNQIVKNEISLFPTCGKYGGLNYIVDEKRIIPLRLNEGFSFSVLRSVIYFFIKYFILLGKSSKVIIGGGSLLHDLTPYNLPFYNLIQLVAKIRKKPVIYFGVGAGPISTEKGKKIINRCLNSCKAVIVRDPVDYGLLKSIGIRNVVLSADNAFVGKSEMSKEEVYKLLNMYDLSPKKYIVVTACQWFKSDNFWNRNNMDFSAEKKKLLIAIQKMLDKSSQKVCFLPTVSSDYDLGIWIKEQLNNDKFIVIDEKHNSREMFEIISNSKYIFGMRMHSLIFAIRAGIPFVATIYDDKVEHLIKRVGMEKYVIPFDRIDSSLFEEKIELLEHNYDLVQKQLINKKNELSKEVYNNINKYLIQN